MVKEKFADKLLENIDSYDVVFLCDFGHGLVDDKVMEIVQERANILVLKLSDKFFQ